VNHNAATIHALSQLLGATTDAAVQICHGRLPAGVDRDGRVAVGAFDPVGIQELLLTSRRPKEVLGASLLLHEWDRRAPERANRHGVHVLYAGAGQSIVIGPEAGVASWATSEPEAFAQEVGGTAAAAALPCTLRELVEGPRSWAGPTSAADLARLGVEAGGGGGFGGLLGVLSARLRVAKDAAGYAIADHDGRRCQSSGILPVEAGSKVSSLCRRFNEAAMRLGGHRGESIAEFAGGVAFVAVDGTGIGARIQALHTMGDYIALSGALDAAFGFHALGRHLGALGVANRDWIPVMAGGDDIVFALAAGAAFSGGVGPLELLHALLDRIGAAYDDAITGTPLASEPPVGAGAGLVVGESVTARIAVTLARKLVKSAKSMRGASGERPRFAIDYEIVRRGSTVSASISDLRQAQELDWDPPFSKKRAKLRMVRRPFALDHSKHLAGLAAATEDQGESGRSLLYRLRQALADDPMAGLVDAAYLLSRVSPSPPLATELALSEKQVGGSLDGIDHALVRDEGMVDNTRVYSTGVAEIIDMATLRIRARGVEGT